MSNPFFPVRDLRPGHRVRIAGDHWHTLTVADIANVSAWHRSLFVRVDDWRPFDANGVIRISDLRRGDFVKLHGEWHIWDEIPPGCADAVELVKRGILDRCDWLCRESVFASCVSVSAEKGPKHDR